LTLGLFLGENEVSNRAGVTQLVECDLAKVDVAGSNPVSRSINLARSMIRLLVVTLSIAVFSGSLAAQDYKLETISSPPPGLPAAYTTVIDSTGYRVAGPSGPWCEIWLRKNLAAGPKSTDDAIVLPFAQGTLLGVIRFPSAGYDRRGQTVKAGVYTLRYSNYPVDGAHQGVAPQRDFALLSPIAADADPDAKPAFEALVNASINGVGTPHPAVFSLETPAGATVPAVVKQGDSDWVLNLKIGSTSFGIIIIGKAEG
jgi:hypothetical protein